MFVIDRNRDVVGYSSWPFDSLYTPVVGCFVDGRLTQHIACDQPWQNVGLDGPLQRWWFRMRLDRGLLNLLEAGDPRVKLHRLEDAVFVPARDVVEEAPDRLHRVEEFLGRTSTTGRNALDGFTDFLRAPIHHQIDVIYLDILGRSPEQTGREVCIRRLEDDGVSVLQLRAEIMDSEEFRAKNARLSAGVGSMITSTTWKNLSGVQPLGERRLQLPTFRLADYADVTAREFVRRLIWLCHRREAELSTVNRLEELCNEHSRWLVASITLRDAAAEGNFFDFIDEAEARPTA